MTNSELKTKISKAKSLDWFKNVQEVFSFPYCDFSQSLTGVSAIYEFVTQQVNGWEKLKDVTPKELAYNLQYFNEIKNKIIQFVTNYIDQEAANLNGAWSTIKNQIKNVAQRPILYNSPQAEFLIKVQTETPRYFQGAYNFLLATNNYNVNSRENLFGAILAYEFTLKD